MKTRLKRLLPRSLYHRLDTLDKFKPISLKSLEKRYIVTRLTDKAMIEGAKRLHAEVYLRRGFIEETDVVDGVINNQVDPYQNHSHYFGVIDMAGDVPEVVAVARQIHLGHKRAQLPVLKNIKLKRTYDHLHYSQVVEISAFAKKRGVDSRVLLLLFGAMFSHSKNEGHSHWLLACDKDVYLRLKSLFGPVIRRVGKTTYYMGSYVVPAEINIDQAPRYLKLGYSLSLPPMRALRKYMHKSFVRKDDERELQTSATLKAYFWDQYSKSYDSLLRFHPYRHLINHVADKALMHKPKKLLDLGCGTGNVTKIIIEKDPDVLVDAVDWSPSMLRQLAKKVRDRRLSIYERDLLSYISLTRKRYDVIVLNNVIYTIKDRKRLWKGVRGRLTDDGVVVIANPTTGDSRTLLKDHVAEASAISMLHPKLVRVWMFDAVLSAWGMTDQYDFTSPHDLEVELAAYGLQVMGNVERCYGGHEDGIDLLLTAKKIPNDL